MDEKHRNLQVLGNGRFSSWTLTRRRILTFIMLSIFVFYATKLIPTARLYPHRLDDEAVTEPPSLRDDEASAGTTAHKTKVELEAHIMSKCPDAKDCLQELVVPAMEHAADMVDFRLSFIGEFVKCPKLGFDADDVCSSVDSSDNTTVKCKHGPGECLGNQLALCAQSLYPGRAKTSLGFSMCMISSYKDIPSRSLVESCALEHAVDFDKLNECISDNGNGEELLRQSVLRSKEKGVVFSCTIRLAGEEWCIRDGRKWKECKHGSEVEDLVKDIHEHFQHLP